MSNRVPDAERQRTGQTGQTVTEDEATAPDDEPGFLQRQRDRRPWLDHVVRAGSRYTEENGAYYAAGITYYTVLALIPVVMVGFAVLGFVLAGNQAVLDQVQSGISASVPENIRDTADEVINVAITQKSAVGLLGLGGAAVTGLGWMSNIRQGLTGMWRQTAPEKNIVRKKLGDLGSFLSLGLALVVSLLISVVGGASTSFVIDLVGLDAVPGVFLVTRVVAIVLSILATWALFSWVIARLPRVQVGLRSAVKGALLAAVLFEVFKQLGSYYLRTFSDNPAFVLFGPIIGILVFVFYTAQMVLFCTAFAATTAESLELADVPVPGPAVVTTQVYVSTAPNVAGVLTGIGIGAAAVLAALGRRR